LCMESEADKIKKKINNNNNNNVETRHWESDGSKWNVGSLAKQNANYEENKNNKKADISEKYTYINIHIYMCVQHILN